MRFMLKKVLFCGKKSAHNPKSLGTQATHGRSKYMAKVALGGTINIQGTKKISRTNLAHLREPAKTSRTIVAALNLGHHQIQLHSSPPKSIYGQLSVT